jgi:uncharacterized protein YukE
MRPQGHPDAVAAGARTFAAAADEVSAAAMRLAGLTAGLAAAGAWQGLGSNGFLDRSALLRDALERAAGAIRLAASGLAELANRLAHAQATWDQARALAASAGLPFDSGTAGGLPAAPPTPSDAALASRVAALVQDAQEQAAVADRMAAACFAEAAAVAGRVEAGPGTAPATAPGTRQPPRSGAGPGSDAGSVLAAGLRATSGAVNGLGATFAAVKAHAVALAGTVTRDLDEAAQQALAGTLEGPTVGTLETTTRVLGPVVGVAIGIAGREAPLRVGVQVMGETIGAGVGEAAALAGCGAAAIATDGAGLLLCPAASAAAEAGGGALGAAAATRIYDWLGPPSEHAPPERPPDASADRPAVPGGPGDAG